MVTLTSLRANLWPYQASGRTPLFRITQGLDGDNPDIVSDPVVCYPWKTFRLFLTMSSVGTGDHYFQIIPEFTSDPGGPWYQNLEGIWAAMFFEDVALATEVDECYEGKVMGQWARFRFRGTNLSTSLAFRVQAAVEFRR